MAQRYFQRASDLCQLLVKRCNWELVVNLQNCGNSKCLRSVLHNLRSLLLCESMLLRLAWSLYLPRDCLYSACRPRKMHRQSFERYFIKAKRISWIFSPVSGEWCSSISYSFSIIICRSWWVLCVELLRLRLQFWYNWTYKIWLLWSDHTLLRNNIPNAVQY